MTLPYSYTRLLRFLKTIEEESQHHKELYFKRETLAKSLSGNDCPLITITNKRVKQDQKKQRKKIIGIIARQHPSQSVGSFVLQGCLKSLSNGSPQSCYLLNKYIFKIVPMINIDGVIYGNSRCDICGSDINRQWSNPDRNLHPIVHAVKETFLKLVGEGYEVDYFLDLHGHSKKLNSFIFGCKDPPGEDFQNRILSYILSKIQPKFNYQQCLFALNRNKRNTARANLLRLMRSPHALTLQTSFFGYDQGGHHDFSSPDIRQIGQSTIYSVYLGASRQDVVEKGVEFQKINSEIRERIREEKRGNDGESSASSESEPYIDEMDVEEKSRVFISKSTIKFLRITSLNIDPIVRSKEEEEAEPQVKKQTEPQLPAQNPQPQLQASKSAIRIRLQQKKRTLTLQKLKITNPLPFALSTGRTTRQFRAPPTLPPPTKSKVVFTIQMPVAGHRDKPLDRQALWESLNPDRGSFWSNFRKEMTQVITERMRKEREVLGSSGSLEMPKFYSVERLTRPFVVERRKKVEVSKRTKKF